MKTGTQQNIIIAVLICMIVVVFSLCFIFPRKEGHVHGWSKWETDGKPFANGFGELLVQQHRVCTNCGYFQGAFH